MKKPNQTKTKASATTSMSRPPPLRFGLVFNVLAIALAFLAFSQATRAVTPAPDGGYDSQNTAEGTAALFSLTSGANNTANGHTALYLNTSGDSNTANGAFALYTNTTGGNNTANGAFALYYNTTGGNNTANGRDALLSNSTGSNNTANGSYALLYNTTGYYNTASGAQALFYNTTGSNNTANGVQALNNNTTGTQNTANGVSALFYNTTGSFNTANGFEALEKNTTGTQNTANGFSALFFNTIGSFNTANGLAALNSNTTGNSNTADGINSLLNNTTGNSNVAVGDRALLGNKTGSSNIAVGAAAGINLTTGSNNIDIGSAGVAGEAAKIRIGTKGTQNGTFIAGISGVAVTGVQVVVNSNGKLGIAGSSALYKEAIEPMKTASEALLQLKPVTFRYKHDLDPDGVPQFGLVAEQVEKVDPDLVARDGQGKPYTVRYEAVNAMLLNEFLKEHSKVEEQGRVIAQLQTEINALASQIQKVSDRLEVRPVAPLLAANEDN